MTAAYIHLAQRASGDRRRIVCRALAVLAAPIVLGVGACADSNIPFYTEPTGVANTPGGLQNAMTGLFAASRIEVGTYMYWMSQFARDQGNIQFDNPQNIQFGTGLTPIPNGGTGVWDNLYRAVGTALAVIAAVPNISPAYTSQQQAALIGVAQTIEALDFMMLAETRDTLGIPVHTAANGSAGPVYCAKDAWAQIVALLDSANNSLTNAGGTPIPVKLPPGFASVSATAGPASAAGSFASFNRALAAKAGLELAYAIARTGANNHPTPTSPGSPDPTALTRADSAATASAFISMSVTPPAAGGFTENGAGVYWDWSAQSGDLVNPINSQLGIWRTLVYLTGDVDTANDLRFKGKFISDTVHVQIATSAFMNSPWQFAGYPSVASPIPIIRNEGLVLIRAEIQTGLGNYATALGLVNTVRVSAGSCGGSCTGGMVPLTPYPTTDDTSYTRTRNDALKEQRISTVFEAGGDRNIAIRMYGLATIADTTWSSAAAGHQVDLHTTVVPVPASEVEGRGGNYTLTCN